MVYETHVSHRRLQGCCESITTYTAKSVAVQQTVITGFLM